METPRCLINSELEEILYRIIKTHLKINTNRIARELSADGFTQIKECVGEEQLVKLSNEFIKIITPPLFDCCSDLNLDVGSGVKIRLEQTQPHLQSTYSFFKQDWMSQISDLFWQKQIEVNNSVYVMHELPGTEHIAQDLHFDVVKTLKFFLYLNDVTTTNGAFSCIPGSHKQSKQIRQKFGNEISYVNRHLTRQLDYKDDQIMPIEGKAGDLIIFNTDVWHRAGIVSKGERRVMRGHTQLGL